MELLRMKSKCLWKIDRKYHGWQRQESQVDALVHVGYVYGGEMDLYTRHEVKFTYVSYPQL